MKGTRVVALALALFAGTSLVMLVIAGWQSLFDRLSTSPAAAHLVQGKRAMTEGRYADAVIAFGRARQVEPQSADADIGLMRARVHAAAEEPSRIRDELGDEVRYDAELLLHLDPEDPRGAAAYHTALGHLRARAGDFEGAKAKYEAALKVAPDSYLAHTALGNLALSKKDGAARAAPEFEAALKTRPGHASALLGLGRLAMMKGEAEKAVKYLTAALAAREDATAHLLLGNAQVRLKNLSDGIAHLERAVQIEPRNADALRSLGQALMAADRSAEAERPLRAAMQIQDDTETAIGLGFALARQRKHGAALDAFTQVLGREPEAPLALFGAGVALEDLGKREEAAISFRRLLALKAPAGRELPGLAQVQDDARQRLTALEAQAGSPGASASAAAGAPPRAPRAPALSAER